MALTTAREVLVSADLESGEIIPKREL